MVTPLNEIEFVANSFKAFAPNLISLSSDKFVYDSFPPYLAKLIFASIAHSYLICYLFTVFIQLLVIFFFCILAKSFQEPYSSSCPTESDLLNMKFFSKSLPSLTHSISRDDIFGSCDGDGSNGLSHREGPLICVEILFENNSLDNEKVFI